MTAPALDQLQPALPESVVQLLQASATVKQYMRRIPPDCRTKALAALAELERRIRDMREPARTAGSEQP